MRTKSRRHIPETLKHEQTQQDGDENRGTMQSLLFRQKLLG